MLDREIVDYGRFTNRRHIASYTGLVPSEHSSGGSRQRGSITKHGNPRVRHILIELAWRLPMFQPDYHAVKGQVKGGRTGSALLFVAALGTIPMG